MRKNGIKQQGRRLKRGGGILKKDFVLEIRKMINETRLVVARAVNSKMALLYWNIGKRIKEEVLKSKRAAYGEEIIVNLAEKLTADYGRGFDRSNLLRMMQLFESFSDHEIVATLSRQLGWSHFVEILPVKDGLAREFYAEMCRTERWSVRTLRKKIAGMLYERTAISKKPEKLIRAELNKLREKDKLTPDMVFRDPYFLDFLGLKDTYQEKDLEDAILKKLELFILEIGTGFSFVSRQKRISIDGEDFYIDLLFYNRKLKRLLAIDLKLGRFKAEYKGQMELYLRWLEKYETEPGDLPPLGLILCTQSLREQVELLQIRNSRMHVAEYFTELPPKSLLKKKLHTAIVEAKEGMSPKNGTALVRKIQSESLRKGKHKMTMREINEKIKVIGSRRKKRKSPDSN